MSFLMKERFAAVGRLLAMELQRVPVKVAADALETSDVTVKKMRRGELPNAITLLRAIERFGLKILEPVVGRVDQASLACRLDRILAEVGDIAHVVSREATAAALAHPHGVVGASGRAGEGEAEASRHKGGSQVPGLALIETRRPLETLDGGGSGALGRSLDFWREKSGRSSVSDLIGFANDNPAERIGVSQEENGSLVFAHLNTAFRLYSADDRRSLIGKPTTAGPDRDYAEACTRKIVDALDGGAPVLDDIAATVRPEAGVTLNLTYDRLILPWQDGNGRVAFVHSRMRAVA